MSVQTMNRRSPGERSSREDAFFVFTLGEIERVIKGRLPDVCPMRVKDEETLNEMEPTLVCCWIVDQVCRVRDFDITNQQLADDANRRIEKIRSRLTGLGLVSKEEFDLWIEVDRDRQLDRILSGRDCQ